MKSSRVPLVVLLAFVPVVQASSAHPHIVLILADDLGFGDVSALNPQSKITTRHIDQLAANGVRFTDAHAGGSVCVPSRYALLTGRFAVRKRLQVRNGPVIDDERETIASLLKASGYSTAMVGKWHLGFDPVPQGASTPSDNSQPLRGGPLDRGFESYFGMHASLDIPPYFYIRGRTPVMPPTEHVEASTSVGGAEQWNRIQGAFWRAGPIAKNFMHSEVTPRFAEEAVKVIQSHASDDASKPLFLYLALPSPHTPWLPLDEFQGKSGAGMYGDFVLQVDAVVGQVMKALEAAGMTQETLFIFSSDNGPVWYEKDRERFGHDAVGGLRGMKASSWEGGHRMPFIASWPNRIAPGYFSKQTIVFSDVFATLAELVGQDHVPPGAAEDSVSFLPWLLDPARATERRAPIVHDQWTIRDGDWKLILPRRRRRIGGGDSVQFAGELYNLREDQAEQQNRIEEEADRAERMKSRLESIVMP